MGKVLDKNLDFGFSDERKDPDDPAGEPRAGVTDGVTQMFTDGSIRIWLAWQRVAVMMGRDLTDGEMLAEQYGIAATLIHELVVCPFPKPMVDMGPNY